MTEPEREYVRQQIDKLMRRKLKGKSTGIGGYQKTHRLSDAYIPGGWLWQQIRSAEPRLRPTLNFYDQNVEPGNAT